MATSRIPEFPTGRITKAKYAIWYEEMLVRGLAYHPDDDAHSIVSAECPDGLFTWEEAQALNYFMEIVFTFIKDPCAICVKLHKKIAA